MQHGDLLLFKKSRFGRSWIFGRLGSRLVLTVTKIILFHYVRKIIGAAGHASLVFCSWNEQNTSLRRSSLPEMCAGTFLPKHKIKKPLTGTFLFCAWEQARTADPSLFRGVLYQLSYPSIYILNLHFVPCLGVLYNVSRTGRGSLLTLRPRDEALYRWNEV